MNININGVIDANDNLNDTKHYHDKINSALEKWMLEGEENTLNLVNEHWGKIEKLSDLLLEKEIIYEEELTQILA
jgi:ATP-dependent Zn protease